MRTKYLLRALKSLTVYHTVPPYNINWFRSFRFLSAFLESHPIVVIDIGARGGSLEELKPLERFVNYIGFDADAQEAERLNTNPPPAFNSFKTFPFYVGKSTGRQDFNLYKNIGSSSQLRPNVDYQQSFDPKLRVDKTVRVEGVTLDTFIQQNDIVVDVLKMDTQGTEYEILLHGERAVKNALLIESEVEFIEMYEGQKLFHDISKHLYGKGFTLLYLNRVFANRTSYRAPTRGQPIFGDALFGLERKAALNLSWERQKKYCALLINYGHIDFAYELFSASELLKKNAPELRNFFEAREPKSFGWTRKIKAVLANQLDKIIYVLLFFRKTNHLSHDSDRSWPIR